MGIEANRNKGFYDIEIIKEEKVKTNRLNIISLDKSEY